MTQVDPKVFRSYDIRALVPDLVDESSVYFGKVGDADSYQYLAESIRTFPDQEALSAMMRTAGLSRVRHRNLTGGIAAIHTGWRL